DADSSAPGLDLAGFLAAGKAPTVDSINVGQPDYLASLDSLVAAVPLDDWKVYARVRTLSEASGLLPSAFGDAGFDFYGRQLRGQEEDQVRWKKAVGESVSSCSIVKANGFAAAGGLGAVEARRVRAEHPPVFQHAADERGGGLSRGIRPHRRRPVRGTLVWR
ncbi:MAG: hypothetical protein ACPGID_04095, partial [Rubricella sp.]